MVLLIIIPMKNGYFIGNIANIFRQTHITNITGYVGHLAVSLPLKGTAQRAGLPGGVQWKHRQGGDAFPLILGMINP